jgi:hypothetical protein
VRLKVDGNQKAISAAGGRPGGSQAVPVRPKRQSRPADALEISDQAKPNAGRPAVRIGVDKAENAGSTFDLVRARLQERIRNDFYANDEVLGVIAGKMLDLFGL